MLSNPTSGQRLAGRLMIIATIAVALPLTATRAINYVDVPVQVRPHQSAEPIEAQGAIAPVAPAALPAPGAPAAPAPPAPPAKPLMIHGETIMIDGKSKKWSDLTPEEKAEIHSSIAEARAELARTRIDRDEIQRDIRQAMAEARADQDDLRSDLAEAKADIAEAMREIDAHSAEIRRSGQNPEQLKASIRASLKSVESIDVEGITRDALASIDPRQIEASVAAAEAAVRATEAELEKLDELGDDD